MKGRHVKPGSRAFVRDLAIMITGILAVGVVVFGGLWLVANLRSSSAAPGTPTAPTSTVEALESTVPLQQETTTTTSVPETTTTTVRTPGEVVVLVLNAKGVAGLAGRVTERLAAAGYQTLPADNYEIVEQSRIWYRDGYGREATVLATDFPDAVIEPLPPDFDTEADLVVVLGSSYEE